MSITTEILEAMGDTSMAQLLLLHATLVTTDLVPAQHFAPFKDPGLQ